MKAEGESCFIYLRSDLFLPALIITDVFHLFSSILVQAACNANEKSDLDFKSDSFSNQIASELQRQPAALVSIRVLEFGLNGEISPHTD